MAFTHRLITYFNPRSLHGERPPTNGSALSSCNFNPRSLHGERPKGQVYPNRQAYFNPRSLHGERQTSALAMGFCSNFNPRSLHGERPVWNAAMTESVTFQSTLPARGATPANRKPDWNCAISIHAPCTGSDPKAFFTLRMQSYFNPRSLHGERHTRLIGINVIVIISIHAPCTGSDQARGCTRQFPTYFNPRSLHGERRGIF